MNHFLALRLADSARDRLAQLNERFAEWGLPAHWTHGDDLHVSVLFLGQCDDDEVQFIPTLIDDVARTMVCPELQLSGLGARGGRREPSVVFAACQDAADVCLHTHASLAACLDRTPDAQYRPTIPLCRPNGRGDVSRAQGTWSDLFAAYGEAQWGTCPTTHLVLYRSTAYRPRYQAIESWPLIGAERVA